MDRFTYEVFEEQGYKYVIVPLGEYVDNISLRELADHYGFKLEDAWLDWDTYYQESTVLYVNWPG